MYCKKCGRKIVEDAEFCSYCGSPVSWDESEKPVLVLKPVFMPLPTALSTLPLQLFFTVWGGIFFGGFGLFAVQALGLDLPFWFTFVFFGCLFFFGIPILNYVTKKRTYEETEYRFYPTRLEYYEGFFTVEEKAVSYKNITEIYLSKGIFQKRYGLGTIILSTPATGFSIGRARSGIRIVDIENPDEAYRIVKELVGK